MRKLLSFCLSLVFLASAVVLPAHADRIEHVIGTGFGLPYGGIGANYELGLSDYFAPTAGLGYLPDNLGWNVGARLYYPGRSSKFRGRITALYGTNSLLETNYWWSEDKTYKTREGFSGGIGLSWRFVEHRAFDVDLFLVDTNTLEGYEKKGSDIKIALGYNWYW